MAKAANFSVNTISSGIKRNGMPEADLALRIAKFLNVPLEKLLGTATEIKPMDKTDFENLQSLFSKYLPYIKKIEKMPAQLKKALFMLIENTPIQDVE